jgi:hypothetical protein
MNPSESEVFLLMLRDIAADVAAQHQLLVRIFPTTQLDGLSVSQYLMREKKASLERHILDIGDRDPAMAERLQKILDSLPPNASDSNV